MEGDGSADWNGVSKKGIVILIVDMLNVYNREHGLKPNKMTKLKCMNDNLLMSEPNNVLCINT